MAGYRVDVSESAENDLRDIIGYVSAQLSAPMTAAKMVDAFEYAIDGLAEMPQKYPFVTDDRLASMGYRKLMVKNYIVFFTVDEQSKTVDIARILYARRNWLLIL